MFPDRTQHLLVRRPARTSIFRCAQIAGTCSHVVVKISAEVKRVRMDFYFPRQNPTLAGEMAGHIQIV